MKIKLPPAVRFLIAGAIFILYFVALKGQGWFDPMIKSFIPGAFLIAAICGILQQAILYAVLPTKKTIQASNKQLHETRSVEANAPTNRDKAIGYWTWLACGVVFYWIWLVLYIPDL